MNRKPRGFTLIELLVVIAIIGILSSIVLVSLRSARNKASDARIISSMSQIRSMAEILYDGSDYDDLDSCDADSNGSVTSSECSGCPSGVDALCDDIYEQNISAALTLYSGSEYCVQAGLVDGGTYCVDSTGYAGTTDIYCDATFDCASD